MLLASFSLCNNFIIFNTFYFWYVQLLCKCNWNLCPLICFLSIMIFTGEHENIAKHLTCMISQIASFQKNELAEDD